MLGNVLAVSAKAKHISTPDPEILLLNKYPREISAYVLKWHKQTHPYQCYSKKVQKTWKQPKCPSTEWICHNLFIHTVKHYTAIENNQHAIYNHMGGSHRCYVEWKKLEIKCCMLCDSFTWGKSIYGARNQNPSYIWQKRWLRRRRTEPSGLWKYFISW